MSAVAKITEAIDKDGLLTPELTIVPRRGASESEIAREEEALGRVLSPKHRVLLSRWNGLALDVIRLFGCGVETGEIGRLSQFQISEAATAGYLEQFTDGSSAS